jgi:hypothetical protein
MMGYNWVITQGFKKPEVATVFEHQHHIMMDLFHHKTVLIKSTSVKVKEFFYFLPLEYRLLEESFILVSILKRARYIYIE